MQQSLTNTEQINTWLPWIQQVVPRENCCSLSIFICLSVSLCVLRSQWRVNELPEDFLKEKMEGQGIRKMDLGIYTNCLVSCGKKKQISQKFERKCHEGVHALQKYCTY